MNQYFCRYHAGVRIYPFSTLEKELHTVAPKRLEDRDVVLAAGKLLISYNASGDEKIAWCFVCGDFVDAEAYTLADRRRMYRTRGGVQYRGQIVRLRRRSKRRRKAA